MLPKYLVPFASRPDALSPHRLRWIFSAPPRRPPLGGHPMTNGDTNEPFRVLPGICGRESYGSRLPALFVRRCLAASWDLNLLRRRRGDICRQAFAGIRSQTKPAFVSHSIGDVGLAGCVPLNEKVAGPRSPARPFLLSVVMPRRAQSKAICSAPVTLGFR